MQNMKWKGLSGAFLTIMLSLPFGISIAADGPQVDFQSTVSLTAGRYHDGLILGKGRVTYNGPHTGFRVWIDAIKSRAQPNSYILEGQQNAQNKLHVRLEQPGWQPDDMEMNGIAIQTGEYSVLFQVVADGEQNLAAEKWQVNVKGVALLP